LQILKDQYAGLGETLQRPAGLVDLPEKSGNILREAWTTTTQVNFCAAAFPTVGETHQDSAALTVLAGVLRNGYLHGEIREKGGAYGGGAVHDSSNGIFRFYSYRDPRLEETFGSFRDSVDWLLSSQLDFAQVEESILSIIGSLDSPGSPAGEARHAFHQSLQGRSLEHRKHYRESILSVSVADIRRVTETYLTRESSQVVITSQSHVQRLADQGFEIQRL
ncbi:MAG: peptidase M16, partial [Gammaproteobacteria bacterium]|nr:peptidase M16 [Gammaproteobacteria bacterium]